MKIFLKRLSLLQEPSLIIQNRIFLQKRQDFQMSKLQSLQSDQSLLNLSIQQLLKLPQNKKIKMLGTFAARTLQPQFRKLNGLADVSIDRYLQTNKLGIPFTVKDQLRVRDLIQTCGYSHNTLPSDQSSDVVELLQRQGCTAYGHTNIPQGLLGIQGNNNVYGLSKNPYKRKFISGGSSSGEGIQVAIRGSVFGVGSDSGGSVRIPAAFCGVYGFKPTGSKRLSLKGRLSISGKQPPIIKELDACMGFLTRKATDIRWLCERTLGKTLIPSNYVYKKWDSEAYKKGKNTKFRIGYMMHNQQIDNAPSITNAMRETIEILKSDGHQLIEFQYPQLHAFRNFMFQFMKISGFIDLISKRLGMEDPVKQTQAMLNKTNYGRIGAIINQYLSSSPMEASIYQRMNHNHTMLELYGIMAQKDYHKDKFLKKWNDNNIDLILSPTMPFTAPLEYQTSELVNSLTFSCFQNVLELPAGNIPIRTVKSSETTYTDCRFFGNQAKKAIQQSQGLPVCLQLTGKHMEDEVCIAAMEILQKLLNNHNMGLGYSIKHPEGW